MKITEYIKFNKLITINNELRVFDFKYKAESASDLLKIQNNSPFIYVLAHNSIKTLLVIYESLEKGLIPVIVDPETTQYELNELYESVPPAIVYEDVNKEEDISETEFQYMTAEVEINQNELEGVAVILFSNAEDGFYKPVMLTHENILYQILACSEAQTINAQSSSLSLLPLYHIFGLITTFFMPAYHKANIVMHEGTSTEIKTILSLIEKCKPTNIYSVPAVFYMLSRAEKGLLENVHTCYSGGYSLDKEIVDAFFKKHNKKLLDGFGLTETCGMCVSLKDYKTYPDSSIGEAAIDTEFKLDADNVLYIKNKGVMKGYYNNKTATDNVLKNGWLYTGDICTVDNNNYLYFKGLKKYMYNVLGHNFYPEYLKRFIFSIENVENVEIEAEEKPFWGHVTLCTVILKNKDDQSKDEIKKIIINNIGIHRRAKYIKFI